MVAHALQMPMAKDTRVCAQILLLVESLVTTASRVKTPNNATIQQCPKFSKSFAAIQNICKSNSDPLNAATVAYMAIPKGGRKSCLVEDSGLLADVNQAWQSCAGKAKGLGRGARGRLANIREPSVFIFMRIYINSEPYSMVPQVKVLHTRVDASRTTRGPFDRLQDSDEWQLEC